MRRFVQLLARFRSDESGVFAVLFGLMAIVLIAMGGATVDYVSLEQTRSRAQVALDAAALALQPQIFVEPLNRETIRQEALALMVERIADPQVQATIDLADVRVNIADGSLYLEAHMRMPTIFVSLVGVTEMRAAVVAEATRKMLDLEVMMVLDNSGSMTTTSRNPITGRNVSRMSSLITAAKCATNILFYTDVDDDCEPQNGAEPSENVKMGVVPFTSLVNIGTKFEDANWLDWEGLSPLASKSFDDDDDEDTPFLGTVNRRTMFTRTRSEWKGCVEARQAPYDTTDDEPDSAEKLFLPLFSPATVFSNKYVDYDGGTCVKKTCTETQTRSCTKSGNRWTCNGAITYRYVTKIGNAAASAPSAISCLPNNKVLLTSTPATINESTRIQTTVNQYSLLSERELQERLCKYNNSNIADSKTNYNCPSAELLPLTNDPDAVLDRIGEMSANGNTNIQQGTIWGLHGLTDSEPLTEADPTAPGSLSKVLIIMTDGKNEPQSASDINGSVYFSWGFRNDGRIKSEDGRAVDTNAKLTSAMNERTLLACASARALGIEVFTIGLAAENSVKDMLRTCATDLDHAHFPADSSELEQTFRNIANDLADLRLAQ